MSAITRVAGPEPLDLTMVRLIHRGLRRDFRFLIDGLRSLTPGDHERAGCLVNYSEFLIFQLERHHLMEDENLLPLLEPKLVGQPEAARGLANARRQHREIDEVVERLPRAVSQFLDTAKNSAEMLEMGELLIARLDEHLDDEERDIFPLFEQHLTSREFARFERAAKQEMGLRGATTFFPWVLHGATRQEEAQILGPLPMPLRLLCRWKWQPVYERQLSATFAITTAR
jgi:hemerythrin-like domain-containing protein